MPHEDTCHSPEHSVSAAQDACGPPIQSAASHPLDPPGCTKLAMHLPGMSRVLLAAKCKHAAQVAVLHQHTLAISDYYGLWLEAV